MLAILNSLNVHNFPIFQQILMIQVSPVITRRLGSTNRIRDIRGTRTNEIRKKNLKKKKKKNFFFFF